MPPEQGLRWFSWALQAVWKKKNAKAVPCRLTQSQSLGWGLSFCLVQPNNGVIADGSLQ